MQHPADDFIQAIKDSLDGTAIKQTLRDAWDRMTTKPAPDSHDADANVMNKQLNDKAVQDANATYTKGALDDAAAARIRTKAGKVGR